MRRVVCGWRGDAVARMGTLSKVLESSRHFVSSSSAWSVALVCEPHLGSGRERVAHFEGRGGGKIRERIRLLVTLFDGFRHDGWSDEEDGEGDEESLQARGDW